VGFFGPGSKRSRGEGDSRTVGARDGDGHSAAIVAVGNTGRCPCFNADYAGLGRRLSARVSPLGVATPDRTTGCVGVSDLRALAISACVRRRIVPKRARARLRGRPMSEKALVILECEEVFENKQLFPSNDPALQPRGLRSLHTWESLYAPAVCRTGWFGVCAPPPAQSTGTFRNNAFAWTDFSAIPAR
jgi:hypothetical protein